MNVIESKYIEYWDSSESIEQFIWVRHIENNLPQRFCHALTIKKKHCILRLLFIESLFCAGIDIDLYVSMNDLISVNFDVSFTHAGIYVGADGLCSETSERLHCSSRQENRSNQQTLKTERIVIKNNYWNYYA